MCKSCENCVHCDKAVNAWMCYFHTWYKTTNTSHPGSVFVWSNGSYIPFGHSPLGDVLPYEFCTQWEENKGQESKWKINLQKFYAEEAAAKMYAAEKKRQEEAKAAAEKVEAYNKLPWYKKIFTKKPEPCTA